MTDLERFHSIDGIRQLCADQWCRYELGDIFSHENLAWVFEKARLQIEREAALPLSVRARVDHGSL